MLNPVVSQEAIYMADCAIDLDKWLNAKPGAFIELNGRPPILIKDAEVRYDNIAAAISENP